MVDLETDEETGSRSVGSRDEDVEVCSIRNKYIRGTAYVRHLRST